MADMFDDEEIVFGYHEVDPDVDDFWYDDDPFDEAEIWLAEHDVPEMPDFETATTAWF